MARQFHAIGGKWQEVEDDPHRLESVAPAVLDAYSRHPVESLALSVHRDQVGDMRDRVRECGASSGCKVDPKGNVTFTSASARKRVMKHVGFVDRQSYGGR